MNMKNMNSHSLSPLQQYLDLQEDMTWFTQCEQDWRSSSFFRLCFQF